jgi:hypothetical protein
MKFHGVDEPQELGGEVGIQLNESNHRFARAMGIANQGKQLKGHWRSCASRFGRTQ